MSNELFSLLADALWRASWQGGLAILLVWMTTRLWRKMPPLLRVWLWRLVYLKLLLTFCWNGTITVPAPAVQLPQPKLTVLQPVERDLPDNARVNTGSVPETSAPVAATSTLETPPAASLKPSLIERSQGLLDLIQPYWLMIVALLWLFGVAWGGGSLALAWRQTGRLNRSSTPVNDAAILGMLDELVQAMGVRRVPALLASTTEGPLLLGLLRPVIIVPVALLNMENPEALRLMLAHELAHIRQHDLRWGWLAAVTDLLFFFHPLVRLGSREWQLTQEIACDALAVRATSVTQAAYGAMLTDTAAFCAGHAQPTLVAVGVSESFRTLSRRLRAMKEWTQFTRKQLVMIGMLVCVLAAAVIIPWRLAAQEDAGVMIVVNHGNGVTVEANPQDGSIIYYRINAAGVRVKAFDLSGEPYTTPDRLFLNALELGDAALVREMLKHDPKLLEQNDGASRTPLMIALNVGVDTFGRGPDFPIPIEQAGVVKVLLDAGADPNEKTSGYYPLFSAAELGLLDVVRTLVDHGARIDITCRDGITPRYQALYNGHEEVDVYLKARGGKVLLNAPPLLDAIAEGDLPAVQRVLASAPQSIHTADEKNRSPLYMAVACGRRDVATLLLDRGVDVNCMDKQKITPLFLAARRSDLFTVRRLLDLNADVNIQTTPEQMSLTPLMAAMGGWGLSHKREREADRSGIVALLLEKGADPNKQNSFHYTPLHFAAQSGNTTIAVLLLTYNAQLETREDSGMTPLYLAAMNRQLGMVELLLSKGANPEAVDESGRTIMATITQHGTVDPTTQAIVNRLEKHGAKVIMERRIFHVVVSPDGKSAAVTYTERPQGNSSQEQTVGHYEVVDLAVGTVLRRHTVPASTPGPPIFTPDSQALLVCGRSTALERLDLKTGKLTRLLESTGNLLRLVGGCQGFWAQENVSDQKKVPIEKRTITITRYDLATGKLLCRLPPIPSSFLRWEISKDEKTIITSTCNYDENTQTVSNLVFHRWDAQTGKELSRITAENQELRYPALSADGSRFASSVNSRTQKGRIKDKIIVWNTQTGKVINRMAGEADGQTRMLFNPEGSLLAVNSSRGAVLLWHIDSGKVMHAIPWTEQITDMDFTPDGTKLITASFNYSNNTMQLGSVKVWDVKSGKLLKTLQIDQ